MCKLYKYILLLIIILMPMLEVNAQDNNIPVRVGISNTSFNTYLFDTVEFNDAQNIEIMDSATGYVAPKSSDTEIYKITSENNLFRIYKDDVLVARNLTGPVLVRPVQGASYVSINNLKRKGQQAFYRGYIELTRSKKNTGKFAIVNVLSLKNYLRGVVPNEMPVKFGLEALKAQTVAARNYAVTPRVKAYDEFDLCDSVACQVYYGANTEKELSDKAIDETNGIIALDKENNLILALYSSTAGGYTESYEYAFSDPKTRVFPSNDIPYLTAVPDNKDFKPLDKEEDAREFYTSAPEAFDDASPYYRWSKEWTFDELEKVLAKTLVAQSKTGFISPALISENDFGKLLEINVLKRGKSGKIIQLEIKTDKTTYIVNKELVIRRCFQKNGISLPSANFVIDISDDKVIKFSGGGFGHGVGLSQWGAGKMASLGYTFDEILQHYYQGIKLSTIPMKVHKGKIFSDCIYYTKKETADLYIKNDTNADLLKITVNNKEIEFDLNSHKKYIDISRYLKNGENKITYELCGEKSSINDFVQVYIVVKEAEDE